MVAKAGMPMKNTTPQRLTPIEELLRPTPSWWMHRGNLLLFFTFVTLFGLSFVLRYPDTVTAPVRITTANPPSAYIARTEGRLGYVFVRHGDTVAQGELLAAFASPADFRQVLFADSLCNTLSDTNLTTAENLLPTDIPPLRLGPLQSSFAHFQASYKDLTDFRQLNYYPRMVAALEDERARQNNLNLALARQVASHERDFALVANQYKRQQSLFEQNLISVLDLEKAEQEKITANARLNQSKIDLANNQIVASRLQQQILNMALRGREESEMRQRKYNEAKQSFQGEIKVWLQDYLFVAETDGIVQFSGNPVPGRYLSKGELLASISPLSTGRVFAIASLAMEGTGRLHSGNQAILRLDNFPYIEYGEIIGSIRAINHLPGQEVYQAIIDLPQPLVSTYSRPIPFVRETKGTALLVTHRQSLFARIFNPLKHLLIRR